MHLSAHFIAHTNKFVRNNSYNAHVKFLFHDILWLIWFAFGLTCVKINMKIRSVKRVSPRNSSKNGSENSDVSTGNKKQKLEDDTERSDTAKNSKGEIPVSSINDDSSDSSSCEFTKPYKLKEFQMKGEDVNPVTDFLAIENNILKGVTQLSDSEESDFEDVIKMPGLNAVPAAVDNEDKNSKSQKQRDLKVHTRVGNKTVGNKSKNGRNQPVRRKRKEKTNSAKNSNIKAENKQDVSVTDVDKMDVSQLLALGEGSFSQSDEKSVNTKVKNQKVASSEEEHTDWEEVSGLGEKPERNIVPKEGVQVTLEIPSQYKNRKKKGYDWEAHIRRRLNRVKKEIQELIHKVHLLCWIAHGNFVNSVLNSDVLMGLALSLIPSQHCYPSKKVDLNYLEQIVKWFSKAIVLHEDEKMATSLPLQKSLEIQFQSKRASSSSNLVLMFICILRALGIKSRLILSLQPLPLKPQNIDLFSISGKKREESSEKVAKSKTCKNNDKSEVKEMEDIEKMNTDNGKGTKKLLKKQDCDDSQQSIDRKKTKETNLKTRKCSKGKTVSDVPDEKNYKFQRSLRERKVSRKYKEKSDTSEEETDAELHCKSEKNCAETMKMLRLSEGQDKHLKMSKKTKVKEKINTPGASNKVGTRKKYLEQSLVDKAQQEDSSSSSEFVPESGKKRSKRLDQEKNLDRRVLSSGSDTSTLEHEKKKKKGLDVWTEVYVEEEEAWISVNVPHCKVHCIAQLYSQATKPVTYILAFNNDLMLKDVTHRYCPQFATVTRKLRVDEKWWNGTLLPFLGSCTVQDRKEDEEMNRAMLEGPMPTSITEFKNHPLYALKRHLLKFEAIYPPDAPPLGFAKGEPVYARECVHTLHSREIWMKEAKVVRLGETPYKIVKARPKYDKMTGQIVKDLPLEVFGYWQVEDYIPPPAVNGKVPRNEYGNVELFKPCMLPKGTVHLQVPGLNRVARKLGIDCASAVVGFDFHCGSSHPLFDGFVVCEEYKDALLDAWNQEQDEAERRQKEKCEKRVYGNWRRIIKGLLIRERLKEKYAFREEDKPGCSAPRVLTTAGSLSKSTTVGNRRKKPVEPKRKPRQKPTQKKPKMESDSDDDDEEEEQYEYDSDKDWD